MPYSMEVKRDWMRIKELSARAGVSRYTIHYYLKEGLLPPPLKTGRTMSLYSEAHLECLRFIRKLREEQGMPIAALRQEVRLHFGELWRTSGQSIARLDVSDRRMGLRGKHQRQRIIERALDLFSEKGYHHTHVSHITDSLRISKATFYLYFKNKHELFVAVFDYLIQVLTRTEEKIADETDVARRMHERACAYFASYKRYHRVFDIIRAESIGHEGKPELSIQAIYRKIIDPVAKDIEKARQEGLMTDIQVDSELASYMVVGSLDFICYRLLMDDKYSLDEVLGKFGYFGKSQSRATSNGRSIHSDSGNAG
ncbi:MAG: MerR family transcriptional regulator [Candidatus Abyssobacteria bacterium SURF_17]|uniref:MerR family transcriptional regulator n=1 Tax=Candidatus Abyssobacteria bacterium SURF_17 TaxID=2093361 RepID=A0A419EQ14_9BACT|nr:MAG: MerR family transcriptional regulator [Candidatus Abyssubacteria bacterium SURF_17]